MTRPDVLFEEIPTDLPVKAQALYVWMFYKYGHKKVKYTDVVEANPFFKDKQTVSKYWHFLKKKRMVNSEIISPRYTKNYLVWWLL